MKRFYSGKDTAGFTQALPRNTAFSVGTITRKINTHSVLRGKSKGLKWRSYMTLPLMLLRSRLHNIYILHNCSIRRNFNVL